MLRFVLLLSCVSLVLTPVFSQKEGNIWHFGIGNALDFSSGAPVQITGSQQSTFEGCASICDADGKLLFYTNGGGRDPQLSGQSSGKIWNRQNQVLYDMGNTEGGGLSAAQSSVFVPKPGAQGRYYLFTMEEIEFSVGGDVPGQPEGRGLSWFEIDANANGGLGAVVDKQTMVYVPSYEGLCAIRNSNGQDYWIIITDALTGALRTFSVTQAGVSPAGAYFSGYANAYLKGSTDGRFLAVEGINADVTLFRFDAGSGVISDPVLLPSAGNFFEFSPNSRYLYTNTSPSVGPLLVRQFDLTASNIPASLKQVGQFQPSGSLFAVAAQMQLGPDHNIYMVVRGATKTYLCALACANSPTPAFLPALFEYAQSGTGAGVGDFFGLPNFANHIFYTENTDFQVDAGPETASLCGVPTVTLEVLNPSAVAYQWSTGATTAAIDVSTPGLYKVTATDACGLSGVDSVRVLPATTVSIGVEQDICAGQAELTATVSDGATLIWENGATAPLRTVLKSGVYSVTATGSDGCTASASVNITLTPPIHLSVRPDTAVLAGRTVQIIGKVDTTFYNGPYMLSWSNANPALSCNDCLSPLATVKQTTKFVLSAKRPDGCTYSDSLTIEVDTMPITAPNVFTPNGDQVNDVFKLLGGVGDEMINDFKVYSRWGETVFIQEYVLISAANAGWDGKNLNGYDAGSDVYYWVAELQYPDGRKEKRSGQLSLLR